MFKNILYECDTELSLSCPDFGRKINTNRYDHIRAKNVPFPSDYILAVFSSLVYNDEFYSLPDNWKLLTTARNSKTFNGYFGAAFWNPVLCQVVVAHRGTKDYNIGALRNDFQLGLKEEFSTSQSKSAATFVYLVSEQIKKRDKNSSIFQLSLTGHSLGAWLAQITAFTTKYFKIENNNFVEEPESAKNIHAHTVVYESPGCRETLANLVAPFCIYKKFSNFDKLDVTVYLSKLNFINCINHQIGTVYYLENAKTHEIKRILDLFDCRTQTIEKQQVEYLRSGLKQSTKRFMSSNIWPFKIKQHDFQLKRVVDTEFSLNVFSEDELDFLTDWNYAIKHDSESVKQFKEKNSIPDFTVDLELNMIKGNDLTTTIACIKHLRPTRTTVIDLLKNDVSEEIHMNILKMEIEHFRKHISDFNGYYFEDKYDIKEFLNTSTQNFLCIQVEMNSEIGYQLETSFVHNVLMFYHKNNPELFDQYFKTEEKYCFLNWNQLNKIKRYLPSVLGKRKEKVNLLIIEWFDTYGEDHETLQKLLKKAAKVIIISTQKYSWMRENDVMVVKGIGNNISFKYLTEESQQEFRKQKYLMLYDESMSLDDIFREECFQNGKIYEHLSEDFLQFMLQSPVKPLVMDCNYKDFIENIVYMDFPYYEVNMVTLLLNSIDNRYLYIIENKEGYDLPREINQPNIKVSSEVEFETECRNHLDKVVYLFKIEDKKLCLNRIFNKDFYVCRNIMFKNIVNPDLFKTTNLECEHYYFYGNKAKYDALLSRINRDQQQFYNYCSTAEEAKESITNLGEEGPVHLFNINGKRIEWRYTRGGIESLRKFMRLNVVPLKETEIIKDRKLLIISGEPGMGKSSTVSCLFLHLKRTHWVFPILLRHSNFDSIKYPVNFNSAARFLLTNSNTCDVTFIQCLLSYCLKHEAKPVYILFDGFDEIHDKENRLRFINLVNFLKYESTAQVLITTRNFTCEELENGLSVFACNYEVINNYKKKLLSFCWIFWRLFQDTIHIDKAKAHIRKILRDAPDVFGETIAAFIGIPLQLRMLTEVIASLHPHQFLEITLEDTVGLYQKYTEVHCSIYFRKCGVPNHKIIEDWLTKCIFDELCNLAIMEMFSLRTDLVGYEPVVEELNKVGIIQFQYKYDNVNFGFFHDSVRDFFVAKLLKLWLEGQSIPIYYNWSLEKFIVSDFLIKGEHREMRYFFNCYLKYLQICKDRLEMCRNQLIALWNSNSKLLLENENQESVFHTCISENLYFVVRYFLLVIINDVSKKTKLLSARNRKHQTPLFMSFHIAENDLNCKESILSVLLEELSKWENSDIKVVLSSTLFAHFITAEDVEKFRERANNYPSVIMAIHQIKEKFKYREEFLQACTLDNLEQVNDILEKFKDDEIMRNYLLLTTNSHKKTGLYLTSNKQIVKRLIKLGCPIDTRPPSGITPLNWAIRKRRTEVAEQLIKQGATNIPNKRGYSSLHYGARFNNLHVLKLLFQYQKNLDIDERTKYNVTPLMLAARCCKDEAVVRFLLDKGADISATDWNGMTPVYHAVAKNHTKLINLFRQRGADINVTDLHGTTPLLYSIKNKQKNMINCLLDNGADVNIGDAKNIFPLQLLREMGEDKIIQKILNTAANTENELKYVNSLKECDIQTE